MQGRNLVLVGLSLMLIDGIFLFVSLVINLQGQAEQVITLILSTEILTPALICSLALGIYFNSKWRSL